MNSRAKELSSNTLIFAIGTIGSKIVLFFMVPLYTNLLTTSEYGTADLIQTVSSLLVPIFSLMIQDAVLRFGLSKNTNQVIILKNALLISLIGSIISLVSLPVLHMYKAIMGWEMYLFFITIINILQNILFSYAKSINMNKEYAICGVLSTVLLAVSNIVFLVMLRLGISGYLLAILLSHLFSVIYLGLRTHAFLDIFKVKIEKKILLDMIKYSIPLIFNNISWWIVNASDRIMIERYASLSDLGLYTAASKIPALISLVNSVFLQAWIISVIREYEENKESAFTSNVFSYYGLLAFLFTSIFILLLKPFLAVYVGTQFQGSWRYVPFLLYGAVFYGFSLFFGAIYSAAKANKNIAISTFFAAVINIAINLLFMERHGAIVGSVSTAASYFAVGIFRMIDTRKFFKFKINYLIFILNTLVVLLQSILVTIGYNIYIISSVALICIFSINIKMILSIPKFIKSVLKTRRK